MDKLVKDVLRKHNNRKRRKLRSYIAVGAVIALVIFIFILLARQFYA